MLEEPFDPIAHAEELAREMAAEPDEPTHAERMAKTIAGRDMVLEDLAAVAHLRKRYQVWTMKPGGRRAGRHIESTDDEKRACTLARSHEPACVFDGLDRVLRVNKDGQERGPLAIPRAMPVEWLAWCGFVAGLANLPDGSKAPGSPGKVRKAIEQLKAGEIRRSKRRKPITPVRLELYKAGREWLIRRIA
jgi:hypothetical protein